jgi:hypothetical protein
LRGEVGAESWVAITAVLMADQKAVLTEECQAALRAVNWMTADCWVALIVGCKAVTTDASLAGLSAARLGLSRAASLVANWVVSMADLKIESKAVSWAAQWVGPRAGHLVDSKAA